MTSLSLQLCAGLLLASFICPSLGTYMYYSYTCNNDVNDCNSNPCKNGATCQDGLNSFACLCREGFIGLLCQENIDDCDDDPCFNGGACVDGVEDFTCVCPTNCTGTRCETCGNVTEPPCNPCLNNGTFVNDMCFCQEGFTGDTCSNVTCGDPPCLPYAENTSTGVLVSDTVTYTCPDGFAQCVNPAVTVCQENGQWGAVSGPVCQRSRFFNLVHYYLYPIPCSSTNLKLTIRATIGSNTGFFYVRKGRYILFGVEFVKSCYKGYKYHYYYGYRYYYYCKWRTDITYGACPRRIYYRRNWVHLTTGVEGTVCITLSNHYYTVVVNGYTICSMRERYYGAIPRHFNIGGHIRVAQVDIDIAE